MWKPLVIAVSCVISTYSFVNILSEWDSSEKWDVVGHSFIDLLLISICTCVIINSLIIYTTRKLQGFKTIADSIASTSMLYQGWIALLFCKSCHVWTYTITSQRIINACGHPLTLAAPQYINWTCIERCDGVKPIQMHQLPFLTTDVIFENASQACSPWFRIDEESVKWTMVWETILFAALLTHILTIGIARTSGISFLFVVDTVSLISSSLLAFVPHTYYSLYNMGGVLRFLGLMHAIVALEPLVKYKQLLGLLVIVKLTFVVLMSTALIFVAEKPCEALQESCDSGFDSFGNTLYFIFVTLSTVGYGDMSPKTDMGKVSIVFIIMASISYLPNILSEVLEMCRDNPIHNRLDAMQREIRQVGFIMHGGTHKKGQKVTEVELQNLLDEI